VEPVTVVGLGELLWDLFPDGERLGGAPANVAYHASVLGDHGVVATRVGQDARGDRALTILGDHRVDVSVVQRDAERPTGVARIMPGPRFEIDPDTAWTAPDWTADWEALVSRSRVVCFGALFCAQPAGRRVVEQAAGVAPPDALRLLDLNLRDPYTPEDAVDVALACANALKLNEEEAEILGRRFGVTDAGAWLLESRGLVAVAVTRGPRGSVLYTNSGRVEHPGYPLEPDGDAVTDSDAVGAGDAFTAALAHHLVRGRAASQILAAANRYASFVASRPGAMPRVPDPVRQQGRATP